MSKRMCFSFEASGHKYRPLDGVLNMVLRLYCPNCGRVVPADQAFNAIMWANVDLPERVQQEIGNPNEPVH